MQIHFIQNVQHSITEDVSNAKEEILHAFEYWLLNTAKLAEKTAYSYRSAVKVTLEYIEANNLSLPLFNTSAENVDKTRVALLARADYAKRNTHQHNRYNAALIQFVSFCGGKAAEVILFSI